jgi:hypothetical protein
MKKDLVRIATTVRSRLVDGHPSDSVKAWRDREVKKLLQKRKETYEQTLVDIDKSLDEIRLACDPVVEDSVIGLARHMRISDTWSMYPSNKLAKVDLSTINHLDLPAFAATCRKRGMHELADAAFVSYENQRNEWKTSPYTKDLQQIRAKLQTLHMDDAHSFWIGESIDVIDKNDFCEILKDGSFRFKDSDGTEYEV